MKIRLLLALVGVAIGFALPAFAQQKDTVDPKIAEQIRALAVKYDEAFNNNDAPSVAALFTENGTLVTLHYGEKHGREAIANHLTKISFHIWHENNLAKTIDRVIVAGNEIRVFGRWTMGFKDDAYTRHVEGHFLWILVREGDTLKIREDDSHEESRSW